MLMDRLNKLELLHVAAKSFDRPLNVEDSFVRDLIDDLLRAVWDLEEPVVPGPYAAVTFTVGPPGLYDCSHQVVHVLRDPPEET